MRVYLAYDDGELLGVSATFEGMEGILDRFLHEEVDWIGRLDVGRWYTGFDGYRTRAIESLDHGFTWEQWYAVMGVQP